MVQSLPVCADSEVQEVRLLWEIKAAVELQIALHLLRERWCTAVLRVVPIVVGEAHMSCAPNQYTKSFPSAKYSLGSLLTDQTNIQTSDSSFPYCPCASDFLFVPAVNPPCPIYPHQNPAIGSSAAGSRNSDLWDSANYRYVRSSQWPALWAPQQGQL